MDDFLNLSESLIITSPKKRILWQLIHSWGFKGLSHIHLLYIYICTLDSWQPCKSFGLLRHSEIGMSQLTILYYRLGMSNIRPWELAKTPATTKTFCFINTEQSGQRTFSLIVHIYFSRFRSKDFCSISLAFKKTEMKLHFFFSYWHFSGIKLLYTERKGIFTGLAT